MSRHLIRPIIAAASLVWVGCVDPVGLSDDCSGWTCGWFTPGLKVTGSVSIGEYAAIEREALVYLFDPADTTVAVESVAVHEDGYFEVSYWRDPGRNVCAFLARATLWSGESSALLPLFLKAPRSCGPTGEVYEGPDFVLRPYAPRPTPFVVTGRVSIDDVPAALDVALQVRDPAGGRIATTLRSDAEGVYRLETRDVAQQVAICGRATAAAGSASSADTLRASLRALEMSDCPDTLRLPDLRFGAYKAVWGYVYVDDGSPTARLAEPGEATVTLLDPADSSVVGQPSGILADHTFHLWFPAAWTATGFPGCDWLVKGELDDGRSLVVPMQVPNAVVPCRPDLYRGLLVR